MKKTLYFSFFFALISCGDSQPASNTNLSSQVASSGNEIPAPQEIPYLPSINLLENFFLSANQNVHDLSLIDSIEITEAQYQTELLNALLVASGLPGKLSEYVYFSATNETGRDMLPRIQTYTKNAQDSLFSISERYWKYNAVGTFFVIPGPVGTYTELPPMKKIIPIHAYFNADRTSILDVCIAQEN